MTKYYRANATTSKKIIGMMAEQDKFKTSACAFSVKHGGSLDFYYAWSMGVCSLSAVKFSNPPDAKLWKPVRGADDGYEPRRTSKEAKALRAEFDSIKSHVMRNVADLVAPKREWLKYDGMNMVVQGLKDIRIVKDVAYIAAPDEWKLVGCGRISDVEFEKATAPKTKKKAKVAK